MYDRARSIALGWDLGAIYNRALQDLKTSLVISTGVFILVLLVIEQLVFLYRLYFHPLCKFPGLRASCISDRWLYKITKSEFPEETFEALHKKYNTQALRIGPNELHITDVGLYKVIYNQTNPFPKYAAFYDGFNIPHTVFAECDPHLHKKRRQLLNPLFSRVGVFKLEPIIQQKIKLLVDKTHLLSAQGPVNTYDAFRLLTTEVILEFAFGRTGGMIEEDKNGFRSWFLDGFDFASQSIPDLQYKPWLRHLSNILPEAVVYKISPGIGNLFKIAKFAEGSMRHWEHCEIHPDHPVVFENLSTVKDQDKVSEAMDILIAGADTTAFTLTTGLFHILSNGNIESRLVQEIDTVTPTENGQLSLQSLGKLEFLNACVKESLRVGMAVPGRLPRVVPDAPADPFIVDGKVVPSGTVVSISTYTMHTDVSIWGPDAREFQPERWMGPNGKGLEQYFCTFGKGTRTCIGQNLAPAEITIGLAYLLRNFELSLSPGFTHPKKMDRFTLQYEHPGLQVTFKPRN